MVFVKLETQRKAESGRLGSVSYRRQRSKHDAPGASLARPPRLTVGVPAAVWAQGKFAVGTGFAFCLGAGADAGRARLIPDPDGIPARVVKGGATFCFGHVPALGYDAAEKESVAIAFVPAVAAAKNCAAQPACFEITLPAWFLIE